MTKLEGRLVRIQGRNLTLDVRKDGVEYSVTLPVDKAHDTVLDIAVNAIGQIVEAETRRGQVVGLVNRF